MENMQRRGFFRGVLGILTAPFIQAPISKGGNEKYMNLTAGTLMRGLRDSVNSEEVNDLYVFSPGPCNIGWDAEKGVFVEAEEFPAGSNVDWDGNKWFHYLETENLPLSNDDNICKGVLADNYTVEFIVTGLGVYEYSTVPMLAGPEDDENDRCIAYIFDESCNLI